MTILRRWIRVCLGSFRSSDEERAAEAASTREQVVAQADPRVVNDLVTALWRLGRRLDAADEVDERTKTALQRHLRSAWGALESAGVEVRDHVGEPYVAGPNYRVISFEERPGTDTETVVDAQRPCILQHHRVLQRGEVVVATPVDHQDEPARSEGEPEKRDEARRETRDGEGG